ncbi:hypothetical protein LXL04_014917 [Taraxacum kok-saghyz]
MYMSQTLIWNAQFGQSSDYLNTTKTRPTLEFQIRADLENLVAAMKKNSAQISQKPSLTDLGFTGNFVQLTALEPKVVLKAIHDLDFVGKVRGQGYYFKIPSRAKCNCSYIEEYDQVLLREKFITRSLDSESTNSKALMTSCILSIVATALKDNVVLTKCEVFYMNTTLFEKQYNSDSVIEDVACLLKCTRGSLSIMASERGTVIGNLVFSKDEQIFDCTKQGSNPKRSEKCDISVNQSILCIASAIFSRLAMDSFYDRSTVMAYDNDNLITPDIKWLGIRPSDFDKHGLPSNVRVQMTPKEIRLVDKLLKEEFVICKTQ